jgi:hypothetical protein
MHLVQVILGNNNIRLEIFYRFVFFGVAYHIKYMIFYTMQHNSLQQLVLKRSHLFAEISKLTSLLHGSLLERYSTCARKDCKCRQGQRHGPHYCLVVNEEGRQRQKYISLSQVSAAREGLNQYKKLQELIHLITQTNLDIMKEEAARESR